MLGIYSREDTVLKNRVRKSKIFKRMQDYSEDSGPGTGRGPVCFLGIYLLLGVSLLFGFPAARTEAASASSWSFERKEEITAWRGEGIESSRVEGGVLRILGREEVGLILPFPVPVPAKTNPYIKIRFRTSSPRALRVFWQPSGVNQRWPSLVIPSRFGREFQTRWVNLAESPEWRGEIGWIGLQFGGEFGWVEIDLIEIGPFSLGSYLKIGWEELWRPRPLHLGTINSLSSPLLFDRPLVSWLNKIAVIILIAGWIIHFKVRPSQKVNIITGVGLALLCLWVIYDVRETYSQFKMAETIYQSYVKPPPGEKTFPALGNFYGFVEVCRDKIPPDSQYHFYSQPDWPYDCRIKYHLYPRRLNSDTWANIIAGEDIPYHVIYNNPVINYDSPRRRLRYVGPGGGFFISEPGEMIARFDQHSFLFRED